ncbi:hypothetical protein BDW22DRAFT_1482367 [Trametopsis cervina]|nr:hypothetical protein BDW22DRAFT_1482367 [Trametopsis cervina]
MAMNAASQNPPPPTNYGEVEAYSSKSETRPKSRKKHAAKPVPHSINYAQKSQDKKSSKKSKGKSTKTSSKKTLVQPPSDVDVNAVPNPAPDTGASRTLYPSGVIYTGVLPVIMPASAQPPVSTSGFSPLPPLSAFATTLATVAASSTSKPTVTPAPTILGSQQRPPSSSPKHVSTVIIVLLAVGAAFLLLGCFVLYKMCNRPRKHHYPTPSLPILQDDYMDERKADPEEESLFGGKDRFSARPGSDGVPLTWTQYPHVSVTKPPAAHSPQTRSPPKRKSVDSEQKSGYPFTGPGASATNTAARSANRISAVSASVYPGSPLSGNIGLAVSGSPLTGHAMPAMQRSNSKAGARRMSVAGRNVSDKLHVPSTYGTSDLYGGVASPIPPTPATLKVAATSSNHGRARVKAPYAPGSVLRASTSAPGKANANPFDESQFVLPPLSPMVKSEDHRERDTKALASALGLGSPIPPSPQTIYPDDSITLAGDHRRSRSQFMSPTTESTSRLGKLMLSDMQSTNSIYDAVPAQAPSSSRARNVTRKRVEEKPPRVPSPPPLPSLAQMAMAHSNPQDFEDYRSPTYSIYGLYEADRKSRNTDGGGY